MSHFMLWLQVYQALFRPLKVTRHQFKKVLDCMMNFQVYQALFRPLKVTRHQFKKVLDCMMNFQVYQALFRPLKVTRHQFKKVLDCKMNFQVYQALFRPLKVTRHQFKKVLDCMKMIRQLKYQEVYAQEKVTKVDSLSLVLSGKILRKTLAGIKRTPLIKMYPVVFRKGLKRNIFKEMSILFYASFYLILSNRIRERADTVKINGTFREFNVKLIIQRLRPLGHRHSHDLINYSLITSIIAFEQVKRNRTLSTKLSINISLRKQQHSPRTAAIGPNDVTAARLSTAHPLGGPSATNRNVLTKCLLPQVFRIPEHRNCDVLQRDFETLP
ncbi:hypothetical protein J6590_079345 [Homalodisca vitripennis]|nr:hypothetical protein J6590_079345 [Homalodisca vitripennis]